jgi:hypothetical protein
MQRILTKAAAGLVLAIMAGAMIFVGVAFIAYAIAVALSPSLGVAGGAAVAGGILLVGPMFWVLVTLLSRPARPKPDTNSAVSFLAALAKDKPLMAVAAAVLVGAADMLLKRRNRS